jgi:CYTH domain-containing protein
MAPRKNKKANLEIERKFLMRCVPDFGKKKWTYLDISQFYFDKNGKRIRYRESIDENEKATYYSTRKKFLSKGTYEEIEFEISKRTFWNKFKETKNKKGLEKTRYIYKYKGLKFEIDKYKDMNLVVMEVELKNINQKIEFPDFIKEKIILEVTDFREFGNFNLSRKY